MQVRTQLFYTAPPYPRTQLNAAIKPLMRDDMRERGLEGLHSFEEISALLVDLTEHRVCDRGRVGESWWYTLTAVRVSMSEGAGVVSEHECS